MQDYLSGGITPKPALSSGVILTLTERTPTHAWRDHPALGARARKPSRRADFGSTAHAAWLGGDDVVTVKIPHREKGKKPADGAELVPAVDLRTKDAQAERDRIKGEGKIPILEHERKGIDSMMEELDIYRGHLGIDAGDAEQTLAWEEDGVWFKIRPDFLIDRQLPLLQLDKKSCWDYKTATNADALKWLKSAAIPGGYDIKAALYLRGIEAVLGERWEFVFLAQEIDEPYAVNAIGASAAMIELANEKIDRAKALWMHCLENDEWPRYGYGITWAEVPNYQRFDWEARMAAGGAV